jgi:hypothetical protein
VTEREYIHTYINVNHFRRVRQATRGLREQRRWNGQGLGQGQGAETGPSSRRQHWAGDVQEGADEPAHVLHSTGHPVQRRRHGPLRREGPAHARLYDCRDGGVPEERVADDAGALLHGLYLQDGGAARVQILPEALWSEAGRLYGKANCNMVVIYFCSFFSNILIHITCQLVVMYVCSVCAKECHI